MPTNKPKIVISANSSWNLKNFRAPVIKALLNAGYDVLAVSTADEYEEHLKSWGVRFFPLSMAAKGTNPLQDLVLLLNFIRIFRSERPDLFMSYTIKPNIYGSLAAQLLCIARINTISGLGAPFIQESLITHVVHSLYRKALTGATSVMFQNRHDRALFVEKKLVDERIADIIPGSGVELDRFVPQPLPEGVPFRFLLVARMLWDKGIGEYVEAARLMNARYPNVEFCLLGYLDVDNPSAISSQQMATWVNAGTVRYLGTTDRIEDALSQAHCVVLPSYREGIPRTLLEAAATARPIVATDVPGCSDVVEDGVTGLLCSVRDAEDLARKMATMLELSPAARTAMGAAGRLKVEREYDVAEVTRIYLSRVEEALSARRPRIPAATD